MAASDNARAGLERELGATLPASVAQLPPERLAELAELIREARRRDAQQFAAATDQALSHIPRLLRGPVRKVVGG